MADYLLLLVLVSFLGFIVVWSLVGLRDGKD